MGTATIIEVSGSVVILAADPAAGACFGCMNQECRSRRDLLRAENPRELPLAAGQLVETGAAPASLLREAILALVPPVLCFITAFTLAGLFFSAPGLRAAIGAAALLGGSFGCYALRRRFPPKPGLRITRIIDPGN
jgi:sigma-E factor negative regulatory protein RseC